MKWSQLVHFKYDQSAQYLKIVHDLPPHGRQLLHARVQSLYIPCNGRFWDPLSN